MKSEAKSLIYSNPKQSGSAPVKVSFALDGGVFTARFTVTSPSIFGKTELAPKEFPFDFDVVEVFVTGSEENKPKYFEFECTPYNQGLQVNVIEPRREFYFGVKNGYEHGATLTATGWEAEMHIPLQTIDWSRDLTHFHLPLLYVAMLTRP